MNLKKKLINNYQNFSKIVEILIKMGYNVKFIGDDFYGIVLDRGGAIVGLTMDLLYPSEKDTVVIGRQYKIVFCKNDVLDFAKAICFGNSDYGEQMLEVFTFIS